MRARQPASFQLPKAAVIYPAYTDSLLAPARDLTLSAHAEGLTLGLKRAGFFAKAYTTGNVSNANVRSVGPMWSLQTLRELLHDLQDFSPDVIVVEHAPLAFGRELFVPSTIAMWARSHRIEICTVSHPEPGLRPGIPTDRVSAAMRTCGALFAHSFAIVAHDLDWSQQLRQFLPETSDAIYVQGAWALIEPAIGEENALAADAAKPFVPKAMASMKYPDALKSQQTARIKLAFVLDGVLPSALDRVLQQIERLPSGVDATLLAPFSAPAVVARYESALHQLHGGSSMSLLGDVTSFSRSGRTFSLAQPATRAELSRILLGMDAVVELPARNQLSDVWSETARAHGTAHFRLNRESTLDAIAGITHTDSAARMRRIRHQIHDSTWRSIAKRIGAEMHLGAQPIETSAELLSAPQEHIEEPAIAVRESA